MQRASSLFPNGKLLQFDVVEFGFALATEMALG